MDKQDLDELEDKFRDNKEILRLISHTKDLHSQVDRMFETINFLEEDVERLKGDRLDVSPEDKNKIMEVLDVTTYKNIAGMMDFLILDEFKKQYISVANTPYLLYPKKIELVTRTLTHDVFQITLSIGHECPHNKCYFVDDDEISIFKELPR